MKRTPLVVAAVFAAGCGSGHHSGSVVISQSGRIGALQMDRSTRADVIAFAGRPDAERDGAESIGPGAQRFRALGYDCSEGAHDDAEGLVYPPNGHAGPFCRTVFWINRRTGKLGDFYTASARYSESHGVRIGTPTVQAEHLVHRPASTTRCAVIFVGRPLQCLTVVLDGGHVSAFALHGRRSEIGVFDCL